MTRALARPVLSHLDPELLTLLDRLRESLAHLFRAPEGRDGARRHGHQGDRGQVPQLLFRPRSHRLAAGLDAMGLSLLPPEGERLWTHAVRVPDGVNEAAVRVRLRELFNIEIGAGLGPLAGKVWRIGLMEASLGARPRAAALRRVRVRVDRRRPRHRPRRRRGRRRGVPRDERLSHALRHARCSDQG